MQSKTKISFWEKVLVWVLILGFLGGFSIRPHTKSVFAQTADIEGPTWDLRQIQTNFENAASGDQFIDFYAQSILGEDAPIPTNFSISTSPTDGFCTNGIQVQFSVYDIASDDFDEAPLHAGYVAFVRIRNGIIDHNATDTIPYEHETKKARGLESNPHFGSGGPDPNLKALWTPDSDNIRSLDYREFRYSLCDPRVSVNDRNILYLVWSNDLTLKNKHSGASIYPYNLDGNISIDYNLPHYDIFPTATSAQEAGGHIRFAGSGSESGVCPSPNQTLENNFLSARDNLINYYQLVRAASQIIGTKAWATGKWWGAVSDWVWTSGNAHRDVALNQLKPLITSQQTTALSALTTLTTSIVDLLYDKQGANPTKTKAEIAQMLTGDWSWGAIVDANHLNITDQCAKRYLLNFHWLFTAYDIAHANLQLAEQFEKGTYGMGIGEAIAAALSKALEFISDAVGRLVCYIIEYLLLPATGIHSHTDYQHPGPKCQGGGGT